MIEQARRCPLPGRRASWVQKARVGGHPVYLTCGDHEDGTLGEIFLDMHKQGTSLRGFMHALAIVISLALQHGVPLATIVESLRGMDFPPQGPVEGSPAVSEATSVVDWVVRELEAAYLPEAICDKS